MPKPYNLSRWRTLPLLAASFALSLGLTACHRSGFPDVPAGYREYAYISNGGSNTVTVLDLVYMRQDHTLQVGSNPTALAANPVRDEVYAVNSQSGTVSVIDTVANRIAFTMQVHRQPSSIAVDPAGLRAYVTNSGSNSVTVLDLDRRRELASFGTGEQPSLVRIAPDNRTLVVVNKASGSISLFDIAPQGARIPALHLRAAFSGCPAPADAVILPDSSKTFIACSASNRVMAVSLAAAPDSWAARQNALLLKDHLLTFLDVGKTPVSLAMKPDGGEIFVANSASDSISEIATWTNEVGGTYTIGSRPMHGVVSRDNSTLWVSTLGADSIAIYSIDDGRLAGSVRTGSAPSVLAFSADEHLLLAADTHSGDVAVIRTQGSGGAALFTLMAAGSAPNAIVIKAMHSKH